MYTSSRVAFTYTLMPSLLRTRANFTTKCLASRHCTKFVRYSARHDAHASCPSLRNRLASSCIISFRTGNARVTRPSLWCAHEAGGVDVDDIGADCETLLPPSAPPSLPPLLVSPTPQAPTGLALGSSWSRMPRGCYRKRAQSSRVAPRLTPKVTVSTTHHNSVPLHNVQDGDT